MKFIERFRALAAKQDNFGLRLFLNELAADNSTFSTQLKDFQFFYEAKSLYFFYSEGEVAFMLVDAHGTDAELADEEKFNEEEPLWFSETSHRTSPFAKINALMQAFLETMRVFGHDEITDHLCILISNSNIVNYEDYEEIYAQQNGAVFHNIPDINREIPLNPNNSTAQDLLNDFRNCCAVTETLQPLFDIFGIISDNFIPDPLPYDDVNEDDEFVPMELSDCVAERDPFEFFHSSDPDFKTTEEGVNPETGERMTIKKAADMPPVRILEPIVNPQNFLDEMVGLDQLKTSISEIVAYARYSKKVREAFPNFAHQSVNLHTIVTGNPGTGKTTMCRIYGGLLHSAGILSHGHTVVATRSSFIGQTFGTEELRMRQCLKMAQGGCLFIDEASQLYSNSHPHDPGRGVIQLMLQLLAEEENRDIAVVLALYANDKSLERLYDLNPGIKSRFANVLTFPDYSFPELLEIARRKAKLQGLSFTAKAWHKFCDVLRHIYDTKDKNYGNAREVVNLLQRCVIKHAVRCEKNDLNGDDLLRLTLPDIADSSLLPLTPRIGFASSSIR